MIAGTTKLALFVTTLSGVLGWWVTDYAKRVLNEPTVYHTVKLASPEVAGRCEGFRKYLVSIKNISTTARLPEFKLIVRIPSNSNAFAKTIMRGCAPNVSPTGIGEVSQPEVSPRADQLEIMMSQGILAGSSFDIPIYFSNEKPEKPKFTYMAEAKMRVLESGIESFILINELRIITFFTFLLALLGLSILYFANKEASNETQDIH
jgi:hypothetical protein